ncbi:MAG: cytochrome c1 [Gammaproteobacteria bacterium]|nr:cytochrome c1 [Gammaproteobacteria bacterium]
MIKLKIWVLLSVLLLSGSALASSEGMPLKDIDVATDKASLQRGFDVYYNLCRMCHRLQYVKYQYLADIGLDKAKIDALRGAKLVNENIQSTLKDEMAHHAFGTIPPDLSLMAKARKHGPQYIYTLLTSYYEKSENVYDNHLFPGLKMPDPFGYSVTTTDEGKAQIEARLKDVVAFLNWSADPKAAERKSLGVWVILYLIVLSILFYLVKKNVWRRLPPPVSASLQKH